MAVNRKHGVRSGLEVLLKDRLGLLRGRRVGLLAHPAAVSSDLEHAADVLPASGVNLCCLFGPEHGIRGAAQDMMGVDTAHDPRLRIPAYSLYGARPENLRPDPKWLTELDVFVIDLQDIGSRYYTYIWTMILAIQACAEAGLDVVVLDRPNPLGGQIVEGRGIEPDFESFVGLHSLLVRHGMTPGEIARLVTQEQNIEVGLEVVTCQGWQRDAYFDELDLFWVMPSPNMPTLDTALVYPGACLIEGTNLSEGRGTTRPFEIIGAPWVDGRVLATALEKENLPGVRFRPLWFCPTFHKYSQQLCGGIQIHVLDRRRFCPFRTGVALLIHAHQLWPHDFVWRQTAYEFVTEHPAMDLLAGATWLRTGVEENATLFDLAQSWAEEERRFVERRRAYLLY